MLTFKNAFPFTDDYKRIKALQKRAFPKNEQFPLFLLWLISLGSSADMKAVYDETVFCGFYYVFQSPRMVFVLYLAVNDKIRSKGYGSRILQELKKQTDGKSIVLNVEKQIPDAGNNAQRISRITFYEKNGFSDTGYEIQENDDTYMILATDPAGFRPETYRKLLKSASLGTYRGNVRKTEKKDHNNDGKEN